jgi:hypothetical protein
MVSPSPTERPGVHATQQCGRRLLVTLAGQAPRHRDHRAPPRHLIFHRVVVEDCALGELERGAGISELGFELHPNT